MSGVFFPLCSIMSTQVSWDFVDRVAISQPSVCLSILAISVSGYRSLVTSVRLCSYHRDPPYWGFDSEGVGRESGSNMMC